MDWIKKALRPIGIGLALIIPSAALAQGVLGGPDSSWYLGASVGQSKAKNTCALFGGTCDATDTSYRLFGGYQINRYVGLELGYQQLGDVTASFLGQTATVEAKVYDLSLIGVLPVTEKFSAYGRLGIYYADVDLTTNVPALGGSGSGTDLVYGVGAQYDITHSLGIRAEWQKYNNVPLPGAFIPVSTGYEVVSIGAIWRFK